MYLDLPEDSLQKFTSALRQTRDTVLCPISNKLEKFRHYTPFLYLTSSTSITIERLIENGGYSNHLPGPLRPRWTPLA